MNIQIPVFIFTAFGPSIYWMFPGPVKYGTISSNKNTQCWVLYSNSAG